MWRPRCPLPILDYLNSMYIKRIKCVCLLLVLLWYPVDARESIIKVHFLHGSNPKKEFIKSEKRWFGGIKGGHVGIEIDSDRVISFLPEGRFHIFPRRKKHSVFKIQSVNDFYNEIAGSSDSIKKTIVEIPLSTRGKLLLDSLSRTYITSVPYDYAFFGMRCSSACHDILGKIGVLRPYSLRTLWLRIFYPKILRRKILKMAEQNNWIVERYAGTTRRIWEKD